MCRWICSNIAVVQVVKSIRTSKRKNDGDNFDNVDNNLKVYVGLVRISSKPLSTIIDVEDIIVCLT